MARTATNQATTIGIAIGKNNFHLIGLNVRFGSNADINSVTQVRLLSGVKQTPNVRFLSPKRSCAANVRSWG